MPAATLQPALFPPEKWRHDPDHSLDSARDVDTSRSIHREARSVDIPGAGRNRNRDRYERVEGAGLWNRESEPARPGRSPRLKRSLRGSFRGSLPLSLCTSPRGSFRISPRSALGPRPISPRRPRRRRRPRKSRAPLVTLPEASAAVPSTASSLATPSESWPSPLRIEADPRPNHRADAPPSPDDSPESLHPDLHPAVPDP